MMYTNVEFLLNKLKYCRSKLMKTVSFLKEHGIIYQQEGKKYFLDSDALMKLRSSIAHAAKN